MKNLKTCSPSSRVSREYYFEHNMEHGKANKYLYCKSFCLKTLNDIRDNQIQKKNMNEVYVHHSTGI